MNESRGRVRLAHHVLLAAALPFAASTFASVERPAERPAAGATVPESSRAAFTQHIPDLTDAQLETFALGNRIFSTSWVAAPASVELFDGLGPYFSRRSCSACHLRDGRSRPPSGVEDDAGALVIGLGREDGDGGIAPDPIYGEQLSEHALPGLAREGHVAVLWVEEPFRFPDGERASLRHPEYEVRDLGYGQLAAGTRSPRSCTARLRVRARLRTPASRSVVV